MSDKKELQIQDVLHHIDIADYKYYDTLSDEEKKSFTPYTVLRWVSALDDSLLVTYNAKEIENVFGKWKGGGKEALNELVLELQKDGVGVLNVSKYCHAEPYDWRIKFSVKDKNSSEKLISTLKDFGIKSSEILQLENSDVLKYQLIFLNDMVNDGFWEMKDHPDLVYQLMCSVQDMVGAEPKVHNWIPFTKGLKNVSTELFNIIKQTQPELTRENINELEYKILLLSYSKESFKELLDDFGYQESEVKKLLKTFKEECSKYGKEI